MRGCNIILPPLHVLVVHLIVQRQLTPSMYIYVTSVVLFSDVSVPVSHFAVILSTAVRLLLQTP